MKLERTQYVARSIFWGGVREITCILAPFLIRTMLIYILGEQYADLGSLFTSVLNVFSLAELGIGLALTTSMYSPASRDDFPAMSALLNFYRICYRIIGAIVLIAGLVLMPFLPNLINGSYPEDINLYLLFSVYLFNTVIGFFTFSYKNAVLISYQRKDITSIIATVVQASQYLIQIFVLLISKNYMVYVIVTPIAAVATHVATSICADRLYPEIRCAGMIDRKQKQEIAQKVKGILCQQVSRAVLDSVDTIVISAYLGLSYLTFFNNYYMIMEALFRIMSAIVTAIVPSVGNALVLKTTDENYQDFKRFNLIFVWITTWFSVCLLCLYQPFMELWMGKARMLPDNLMYLFVLNFFINRWMDMTGVYLEASGLWWKTRYASLATALMKLVLDIVLVQSLGLAGILLSTVLTVMFINNTFCTQIVIKNLFHQSSYKHFLRHAGYLISMLALCVLTYWLCSFVTGHLIFVLFARGIICVFVPNLWQFLIWRRTEEFRGSTEIAKYLLERWIKPES